MKRMRKAALGSIAVLALAALPASADPQPRVIGGSVADPADWPAIVALTAGPQEE